MEPTEPFNSGGAHCSYCTGEERERERERERFFVLYDFSCYFFKFIRRNLTPYTLEDSDVFTYEVVHVSTDNTRTAASTCTVQCFQEPVNLLAGHETVKVSFVARMSGDYQVNLNINNKLIGGQVHVRSYIAG